MSVRKIATVALVFMLLFGGVIFTSMRCTEVCACDNGAGN